MKKVMIKALFGALIFGLSTQNASAAYTYRTMSSAAAQQLSRLKDAAEAIGIDVNLSGSVVNQMNSIVAAFRERGVDVPSVIDGTFDPAQYITQQVGQAIVTEGAANFAEATGAPAEVIDTLKGMAAEELEEVLTVVPSKTKELLHPVAPSTSYFGWPQALTPSPERLAQAKSFGTQAYGAGISGLGQIGRPAMWAGSQIQKAAQAAAEYTGRSLPSGPAFLANLSPEEQAVLAGLGTLLAAGTAYKGVQRWRQPGVNLNAALEKTRELVKKAKELPSASAMKRLGIRDLTSGYIDTLNRIQAQLPKDDKTLQNRIEIAKANAEQLGAATKQNEIEQAKEGLVLNLNAIALAITDLQSQHVAEEVNEAVVAQGAANLAQELGAPGEVTETLQGMAEEETQEADRAADGYFSRLRSYGASAAPYALGAGALAGALALSDTGGTSWRPSLPSISMESIRGVMPSPSEWSIPKPSLPSIPAEWATMLPSGHSAAIGAGLGAAALGGTLAYKKGWIPGFRETSVVDNKTKLQNLTNQLNTDDNKSLMALQKNMQPIYDLLSNVEKSHPSLHDNINTAIGEAIKFNREKQDIVKQAKELRTALLGLSSKIL